MSLTIQQFSLRDFLAGPSVFVMARYQRHYEWMRPEMQQLLADLLDAYERGKSRSDGGYHFFNNIIVYPGADGLFQVVDGQQRLTSLSLVLAAARDVMAEGAVIAEIDQALHAPTGDGARLVLHRGDNAALAPLLMQSGSVAALPAPPGRQGEKPGRERLHVNAALARNWMSEVSAGDRLGLVRFILNNTRFGRILVEDEDEAFRIFEIVNSRGRDLASEDVLRYALIEFATDDAAKRNDLLSLWDALEVELGASSMKRFIGGWKKRATGGEAAKGPLHRIVLSTFKEPAEALSFLETELAGSVAIFREIDEADVAVADPAAKLRIDAALVSLRLLQAGEQMGEWMPVATMLIERYRSAPADLMQTMVALERLAWYFYIYHDAKGIESERRKRFDEVIQTLSRGSDFARVLSRMRLRLDEQELMLQKFSGRIDNRWMPLRSLLVLLEMHLSGLTRRIARSSMTVEHVLPVSAKRVAWRRAFGEDAETLAKYALSLGNLCLVPSDVNKELDDKIYKSKRQIILSYGLHQSTALAADINVVGDWTPAIIDGRTKRFTDTLCDIFGIAPELRR